MPSRRSTRLEHLSGAAALLDALEPAHHALTRAMAQVPPTGPTYAALVAVSEGLHRLADILGHAGRFTARPPANGR